MTCLFSPVCEVDLINVIAVVSETTGVLLEKKTQQTKL